MSDIRPIIFAEFPIKTKFSCDGEKKYRYLWKAQIINQSGNGKIVTFVMLNPSTADENSTDLTIDKCLAYAYVLGYSTLRVVNLFAYRAPKPECLPKDETAVGPCNDSAILHAVSDAQHIVCAWGNGGKASKLLKKRGKEVRKLLEDYRKRLYCLGCNGSGEPTHPLSRKLTVVRKNKVELKPYKL